MTDRFTFIAELWRYPGDSGWHFVTLPPDVADDLDEQVAEKAGFGSIRVEVRVGETTWLTSLFPDKGAASYVLPVKRDVRDREGLAVGDRVTATLLPVGPPGAR